MWPRSTSEICEGEMPDLAASVRIDQPRWANSAFKRVPTTVGFGSGSERRASEDMSDDLRHQQCTGGLARTGYADMHIGPESARLQDDTGRCQDRPTMTAMIP